MSTALSMAASRLGAWMAIAAVGAAAAGLGGFAHSQLTAPAPGVDTLVAGTIAALGAITAAYLVGVTVAAAATRRSRATVRAAVAEAMPTPWRALVSVALGLSVSVSGATAAAAVGPGWGDPTVAPAAPAAPAAPLASPAPAVAAGEPSSPTDSRSDAAVIDVGWSGAADTNTESPPAHHPHPRDTGQRPSASTQAASAPAAEVITYTVRRGDCLWDIAAEHLGADASHAQIDREWRRIWRANHDVVGDDPHLIFAGQRLVLGEGVAA